MSRINLAARIEEQLPAESVRFVAEAGKMALSQGQNLYLVGGVVRDLLLGKTNFDLDLVLEGDAINLAKQLNEIKPGKMTTHPRFNTAKIKWDDWNVDLTTARSETYARPGALPAVKPGPLKSDLLRRDFTINAMAIDLNPSRYGELIDLYGGRDDLEHKLVRVLHENSFIDDATRIWRALRYEQRLNFQLEEETLGLLKRDIPMLETISGDRIRYELECIFQEERPEKVLRRAGELGVMPRLYPSLRGDGWLAAKFEQARQLTSPRLPSTGLYLALLTHPLTGEATEYLISYLRLSKPIARTIRDAISLKPAVKSLADPKLPISSVYHLLEGYNSSAITAHLVASDSPAARRHIQLYLAKLRYVKPALTGDDLLKMDIPQGPRIKEMLAQLLDARLDGKVSSKKGEVEMVEGWMNPPTQPA